MPVIYAEPLHHTLRLTDGRRLRWAECRHRGSGHPRLSARVRRNGWHDRLRRACGGCFALCVTLANGCTSVARLRPPHYDPRPTDAVPLESNDAARIHDPAAFALRAPALRSVVLPRGDRELRLSTGPGMIAGAEYGVLRIVQTAGRVDGEVWRYRSVLSSNERITHRAYRSRVEPPIGWARLLARVDSLTEEGLEVPLAGIGFHDAGALYVESLAGNVYWSSFANAPSRRTTTAARRAALVEALVDSLIASRGRR